MRVALPLLLTASWLLLPFAMQHTAQWAHRIHMLAGLAVLAFWGAALRATTWRLLCERLASARTRPWVLGGLLLSVAAVLAAAWSGRGREMVSLVPLSWAVLLFAAATRAPLRNALLATWIVASSLVLTEAVLRLIRTEPRLFAGTPVIRIARTLYQQDRAIIQFMPQAAAWHDRLGYTLRPNASFRFTNTEFDNAFRTNSLGLRDVEEDAHTADVIVLGDSFTMGWGVEQSDCYVERLQRSSGLRVLNAGISSFGTARALLLLGLVPARTTAKRLIIQYHDGDVVENEAFCAASGRLETMSREAWQSTAADLNGGSAYSPGSHVRSLLRMGIDRLATPLWPSTAGEIHADRDRARRPAEQAATFLSTLELSPTDLSGFEIMVFGLSAWSAEGDTFVAALENELQRPGLPRHLAAMRLVRVADVLGPGAWFDLDDHLNPEGHARLAGRLDEQLRRN